MPDYPRPHRKHVVYNLSQADSYHGMPVDLAVTEFFQSVPELPEITPWDWVTESDDIRDAAIAIVRGYIQRNNIPEMTPAKTPMFSDPVVLASPPFYWGRTQLLDAESAEVLQEELVHELQQALIDRFPLWRIRWETGRPADDVLIYPDAIYVGEWDDLPLAEALDQWRSTIGDRERQQQSPEVLKLRWLQQRVDEAFPRLADEPYVVLGVTRYGDEWEGEELLSVWLLIAGERYGFRIGFGPTAERSDEVMEGDDFPVASTGEIGGRWTDSPDEIHLVEELVPVNSVSQLVVQKCERIDHVYQPVPGTERPIPADVLRIVDTNNLE